MEVSDLMEINKDSVDNAEQVRAIQELIKQNYDKECILSHGYTEREYLAAEASLKNELIQLMSELEIMTYDKAYKKGFDAHKQMEKTKIVSRRKRVICDIVDDSQSFALLSLLLYLVVCLAFLIYILYFI